MTEIKRENPSLPFAEPTDGPESTPLPAGAPEGTLEAPAPQPVDRVLHPLVRVDDTTILPRDYLIHKRTQRCLNCHTVHEWSDVYARNLIPPQNNLGKHVINLVPVQRFMYQLPVHIVTIEARVVPACHECLPGLDLRHLPDPRDTEAWQRAVKRKLVEIPATKPKGRPAKESKKPSLDSILGDFT